MAARRRGESFTFGSDSFLDIVANMVGILIILIVIVGLRVRHFSKDQAPETASEAAIAVEKDNAAAKADYDAKQAVWLAKRDTITKENARRAELTKKFEADRDAELERRRGVVAQNEAKRQEHSALLTERQRENAKRARLMLEYEAEAQKLAESAARLGQELGLVARKRSEKQAESDRVLQEVASRIAAKDELQKQVERASDYAAQQADDARQVLESIKELRRQIAQLEAKPKETRPWVHYATAIAKRVQQKECHFRCLGKRVANIHLEALLERAKEKVMHGPASAPLMSGVVGPINGFRLSFAAARTGSNLADQVNNPFLYRVQLAAWEIVGESDQLGETADVALAPGSRFLDTIRDYPKDLFAITLWVYPDSFELARTVRAYLHQAGYNVALRPLPLGVPIAGSPWGTASQVQ